MIIDIYKQTKNQFRFLKPPKHDCLYIGFFKIRVRIGRGQWLYSGGYEKRAPGPQTPPIPKYKNEVA